MQCVVCGALLEGKRARRLRNCARCRKTAVRVYREYNLEECPHSRCNDCGQQVNVYPRKLHAAMVASLAWLVGESRRQAAAGEGPWVEKWYNRCPYTKNSLDYSLLKHWGFARRDPHGLWRPLRAGIRFVEGRARARRVRYIYNDVCVEVGPDLVTFREALDDKFDYAELMGWATATS